MMDRYAERGGLVSQGISAEMIADQWDLSREDLDAFVRPQPAVRRPGHGRGPLRARDRARWPSRTTSGHDHRRGA